MEPIIVDQTAALIFSDHRRDLTEIPAFRGHDRDRGAIQVTTPLHEAQIPEGLITEVQVIQVDAFHRDIPETVDLPAAGRVSVDLPAGHPAVHIQDPPEAVQGVQEAQAIAAEEDIDLPLFQAFINC